MVSDPHEFDDRHTVANMAARSAFIKLATTRPDASALAHALVKGPLNIYGTFAATIYAPDVAGLALELQGQWGFGQALATYASLPMNLHFPATAAFARGEPIFVQSSEVDERYPLMVAARDGILREQGIPEADITIVAMPLPYQGVPIGVCTWWCTYTGAWTWNDYTYLDGTAASIAMWLQLSNYEATLQAAGLGVTKSHPRRPMLSDRQRSVLLLIRAGKSNEAIAAALGYSVSTVKNDVQGLFTLLGCTRRAELIHRAEMAGLIEAEPDEVE